VSESTAPPAARNLDPARESAILDAALELLTQVGYDRMTIDEVARRARASKATIYRRWPNKAAMVAAVLHRMAMDYPPLPDTGTLRGDLLAGMRIFCRVVERKHAVVAGLTTAVHADAELGRLLHENVVDSGFEEVTRLLDRAVARGELPAARFDPGPVLEVCEALVWHRLLLTDAPLDEAFVTRTVDAVVLPLLRARS
jgi:AcrR family transcriptional regulator